eukprot:5002568-Amphidinium_carterae.2
MMCHQLRCLLSGARGVASVNVCPMVETTSLNVCKISSSGVAFNAGLQEGALNCQCIAYNCTGWVRELAETSCCEDFARWCFWAGVFSISEPYTEFTRKVNAD